MSVFLLPKKQHSFGVCAATTYHLYQCHCAMPHIHIATLTSTEQALDWYNPGSTMILALGLWTSQIITMQQ